MIEVTETVEVDAPAETTWAAMTDWTRQGDWMLGTHVRVTRGDGRSAGSALAAFTGFGKLGFTDTMEITAWEPPYRCVVRHTGGLVRGTGIFEVLARGADTSAFRWHESLHPPLGALGSLGWRVVEPAFRYGLRRSLRQFAEFAESHE
ncbi:MAG: SRPBCC family protein [Actinomycetota bacterium]|nr:SRPBCC family protein [Actinomycetota bacterium]